MASAYSLYLVCACIAQSSPHWCISSTSPPMPQTFSVTSDHRGCDIWQQGPAALVMLGLAVAGARGETERSARGMPWLLAVARKRARCLCVPAGCANKLYASLQQLILRNTDKTSWTIRFRAQRSHLAISSTTPPSLSLVVGLHCRDALPTRRLRRCLRRR